MDTCVYNILTRAAIIITRLRVGNEIIEGGEGRGSKKKKKCKNKIITPRRGNRHSRANKTFPRYYYNIITADTTQTDI